MKKILLVISLALATMAVNAQLYVGGSLGYSSTTDKDFNGDKTDSSTDYSFSPKIGFELSDVFSVGLGFSIGSQSTKTFDPTSGDELSNPKLSTWGIAPFARYTVAEFGKLSLLGEGTVYFGGSTADSGIAGFPKSKSSQMGINVMPVLQFAASDNISLEASLNFLNLGYSSSNPDTAFDATTSSFDFGANTNNLMNTGNFQIGFIYKF